MSINLNNKSRKEENATIDKLYQDINTLLSDPNIDESTKSEARKEL
jgi:hypothetical protein